VTEVVDALKAAWAAIDAGRPRDQAAIDHLYELIDALGAPPEAVDLIDDNWKP
jgi:hypothetical protein